MPSGDLYGQGAQLLESAASSASDIAKNGIARDEMKAKSADNAASEAGAMGRQVSAQQATQALEKLKSQEKLVTITPQMAMGLVKNTGDKEWLTSIGQELRPDILLGLYTHGMALQQAKKAPKITEVYDGNGKIRHAVVYTDEEGNVQQHLLDEGMTPEHLNKGKGKGATDDTFKKNKEFMRAHEKQGSLLNDAVKSKQLQATDPDQYTRMREEYEKDQDRYDKLTTEMGAAGAGGGDGPAAGGSSAAPENTPFDADALINEALGKN